MSKKTINFTKPKPVLAPNPDNWVKNENPTREKPKRLTIDISGDLHRRIKMSCVERGVNMANVMRGLLENEFPESDSR